MERDVSKVFLIAIGENVKKFRKKKNLTMEQLGLEIGLTRMQVNRIEKGYNITLTTLLKLSIALEIKPEQLIKLKTKFNSDDLENLVNTNKSSKLKSKKSS